MKKEIDTGKCKAYIDFALAFIKISRELTDKESEYVKAKLAKMYGEWKLEELESDFKEKTI
ncbi:MAG: hypothetical protein HFJ30_00275 [Clostridia bacterium]|jgi:hypothetical protein|nr:hypothetical protein [Clostridia bacterium]